MGYKFILFEGTLQVEEQVIPLVCHAGFDENYTSLSFTMDASVEPMSTSAIDFSVDILQMFKGLETIDMATLPTVKFDRHDARLIAGNLSRMVSP